LILRSFHDSLEVFHLRFHILAFILFILLQEDWILRNGIIASFGFCHFAVNTRLYQSSTIDSQHHMRAHNSFESRGNEGLGHSGGS
jgi:hypothetical protein